MPFEGPRQPKQESPSDSSYPELLAVANKLQALLALRSLKEHHPDISVDPEHPENNSSEVRTSAIQEWIADGSAASFRDYIESPEHVHDHINPEDAAELRELLHRIRGESDTLH